MKRIIILPAFMFFLGSAIWAQATCARHVEASGGFSYCPPAGWTARDSPSGPYKSFFAPADGAVKANMNVKTETTSLSHDAYMGAALRNLLEGNEARGAEARKILGWTTFTTDSKLTGSRMTYEVLYRGVQMRIVQVILDTPGKKLLLTGTATVSDKDTTDKIFDAVARSMALNR